MRAEEGIAIITPYCIEGSRSVTSTSELEVPRITADDLFEGQFKVFLTLGTLGIVLDLEYREYRV